jgi:hypothetical protein
MTLPKAKPMRHKLFLALAALVAATPGHAATSSHFGHKFDISAGDGDDKAVLIDGKAVGRAEEISIDQTATIDGVGVAILSLSPGGNACDGDVLVVSFPKDKPFRADTLNSECREITPAVHDRDIHFSVEPTPSRGGWRWIWTPDKGVGARIDLPYRTDPEKNWANLRASRVSHPADLFKFADIGRQLRHLIGGDFDDVIAIIDGVGSGEFQGDYFVGTSSLPHMAEETGALIVADPQRRRVFIAWKAENKKIVVRPHVREWPETPRGILKDWAEPWRKPRQDGAAPGRVDPASGLR